MNLMKKNIPYIVIMLIAIIIGTSEYGFKATIGGFGIIIIAGIFFGLIILFIKRFLK